MRLLASVLGLLIRSPGRVWIAGAACFATFCLGLLVAHPKGYREGLRTGRHEGRAACEAGMTATIGAAIRDAMNDREEAGNAARMEMDTGGGDPRRVCAADPACRDRHELRVDPGD